RVLLHDPPIGPTEAQWSRSGRRDPSEGRLDARERDRCGAHEAVVQRDHDIDEGEDGVAPEGAAAADRDVVVVRPPAREAEERRRAAPSPLSGGACDQVRDRTAREVEESRRRDAGELIASEEGYGGRDVLGGAPVEDQSPPLLAGG